MRVVGKKASCWIAAGVVTASLLVSSGAGASTATPSASAPTEARLTEGGLDGFWSNPVTVSDQRGRRMRVQWWANDCGWTDIGNVSPGTRVRMWPVGTNHRIDYFRAKIMWQEYNPVFDRWNTTLQRTYTSPDYLGYQTTTWLSPFHRFGEFNGIGRLVVKFTGVREVILDLNRKQIVAQCGGIGGF